jgi:transcriptional regulator with XRE-family HTH domain
VSDGREYLPDMAGLRRRRLALGLSQRWIARRMEVDQTTVSNWETETWPISAQRFAQYQELLDEQEAADAAT